MRYVPYIYFLRIPLIFAIIVVVLPAVGLWIGNGPNPMLGGFFDLSPAGVFVVCLAAFFYGSALSVAATLVLSYGRDRFFAAKLSEDDLALKRLGPVEFPKIAVPLILFFSACILALVAGVVEGVDCAGWVQRCLIALVAFVAFAFVLFGVAWAWKKRDANTPSFIAKRLTWTPYGYLQPSVPPPEDRAAWPVVNPPAHFD